MSLRQAFNLGAAALAITASWSVLTNRAPQEVPAKSAETIRICASNVLWANPTPEQAAQSVLQHECDLVVLMERVEGAIDRNRLQQGGLEQGAGYLPDNVSALEVLHNHRVPVTSEIKVLDRDHGCKWPITVSRVETANPVTVFGVHAPPPAGWCMDARGPYLERLQSLFDDGRLTEDFGPGRAGDPVVVVGDLNTLPVEPPMLRMWSHGLRDAHAIHSLRYSPTWPALPGRFAVGRIDYTWTSKWLSVAEASTFDVPGSDHRGVSVDINVGCTTGACGSS